MEHAFWLERWKKNEIGFHQDLINPWLAYYYGEMGPPPERRAELNVFVPMCGKSKDLMWLNQNGYPVVGVELSEIAVTDFFREAQLEPTVETAGEHTHHRVEGLSVFCGDFFTLDSSHTGRITDVFDRASLIALPTDMRRDYVEKMSELLEPGTRILLVTLSYPTEQMDGPPFSVTEEEVIDLYTDDYRIDKLAAKNIIDDEPHLRDRGLSSLTETAYKLTRM